MFWSSLATNIISKRAVVVLLRLLRITQCLCSLRCKQWWSISSAGQIINIPRRQTLATYRISAELAFGSSGGAAKRRLLYVFKSSLTDSRQWFESCSDFSIQLQNLFAVVVDVVFNCVRPPMFLIWNRSAKERKLEMTKEPKRHMQLDLQIFFNMIIGNVVYGYSIIHITFFLLCFHSWFPFSPWHVIISTKVPGSPRGASRHLSSLNCISLFFVKVKNWKERFKQEKNKKNKQ